MSESDADSPERDSLADHYAALLMSLGFSCGAINTADVRALLVRQLRSGLLAAHYLTTLRDSLTAALRESGAEPPVH